MSRIGRKPIVIPAGVDVTIDEAEHTITVKGPKGSLHSKYHPLMTVRSRAMRFWLPAPMTRRRPAASTA